MEIYKNYIDCQIPLNEIPEIIPTQKETGRVVIIGASFAGLSTALLMSRHFSEVVIVEKEKLLGGESIVHARQGRQAHVICNRSIQVLSEMLPGFIQDLDNYVEGEVKNGFLRQKFIPSTNIKYSYHSKNVSDCSGFDGREQFVLTRDQLEHLILKRIESIKNISIRYETPVVSINISDKQVQSVTLSDVDGKKDLSCSLLINCGGINSHMFINPLKHNLGAIEKSEIKCNIIYKTILFTPKKEFVDKDGNFAISNHSDENGNLRRYNDPYYMVYHVLAHPKCKGFLAMPYKNGKLLFMLDSYNTPIDNFDKDSAKEAILEYCKDDLDMLRDATEILSRVEDEAHEVLPAWPKAGSQFIDYKNLGCGNLICLGDSVGSLNPIYGQGITMSIESALLFDRFVERNGSRLSSSQCSSFQSELNAAYFFPWFLCSTMDTCYSFTKVTKDLEWQRKVSSFASYLTYRLFSAANQSEKATDHLFSVLFMEEGFRKKLFNPAWILGLVFVKELLCLFFFVVLFLAVLYK